MQGMSGKTHTRTLINIIQQYDPSWPNIANACFISERAQVLGPHTHRTSASNINEQLTLNQLTTAHFVAGNNLQGGFPWWWKHKRLRIYPLYCWGGKHLFALSRGVRIMFRGMPRLGFDSFYGIPNAWENPPCAGRGVPSARASGRAGERIG